MTPSVEIRHVIPPREGRIGDLFAQELAERAPSLADLVFQQLFGGYETAHFSHMVQVNLFALVGEIAAEECFKEFVQHGEVHAGGPAEVGYQAMFGVGNSPPDGSEDGSIREGLEEEDSVGGFQVSGSIRMP